MITVTNKYAHKDMLSAGLAWLKEIASGAAQSFTCNVSKETKLWLTVNGRVPSSGTAAWKNALAKREIYSEEITADIKPIFNDIEYCGDGSTVLNISPIGSMEGLISGVVICVCFLARQVMIAGDPDSTEHTLLYMAEAKGSVKETLPVLLEAWCIKNPQPFGCD